MAHARLFTDTRVINMITWSGTKKIKDIFEGYKNNSDTEEGGITSMNDKLNIRPRYQRLYIRENDKVWKDNLINSIICKFPINRVYFGVFEENGVESYELLDGQQRLITICEFLNGKESITINGDELAFAALPDDIKEDILNYEIDVTYCKGDEDARIKWFKRINQPNSILTEQEFLDRVPA